MLIKISLLLAIYLKIQAGNWIQVDLHKIEWKQTEFIGIHCTDSLNCAAAANLGVDDYAIPSCRATTDGGKTWFTAFMDTSASVINKKGDIIQAYKPPKMRDIAYPDTSLCVITCDSGVFWVSKDKLNTWKKNRFPTYLHLLRTKFLNAKVGGIINSEKLYLTNDGFESWQIINFKDSVADYNILDVEFSDTNTIYLLTTVDTLMGPRQIFKSSDFGKTWKKIHESYNYIFDILTIDNEQIWYCGAGVKYQNIIFYSSNSGNNWKKILDKSTKTQYGLSEIYFKENYGFALGVLAVLFYSSNYGETWIQDTSFYYPNLHTPCRGLAFLTKSKVLVVSNANGTIWMKDFSDLTKVEERDNITEKESNISISPNPAGEYIEIALSSPRLKPWVGGSVDAIKIFNLLGECVLSVAQTFPSVDSGQTGMSDLLRIDVSGLPAGVYLVRVGDWVGRFLKI